MSLNLAHFLERSAQTHTSKTALSHDGVLTSYTQLATNVRKVAHILREHGVRKGDKVVVMLPNVPAFTTIYYGILTLGAVVVPINHMLKSHEIAYCLEDSDAKVFFAWRDFGKEAFKAFGETETCHHLIVVNPHGADEKPPVGQLLEELLDGASDIFAMEQTMPDDTAVILYTSGTTGHPKGAELTHFNMFFNALITKDHVACIDDSDIALAILPLFHSFGQTCIQNACVLAGATICMMSSFDPKRVLQVIRQEKISYVAAVPAMYTFLLQMARNEEAPFAGLRAAISGGSSLPVEILKQYKEKYDLQIYEGYGLSETSPVASFNIRTRKCKPGSIGLPIWGCNMAVMREDGTLADVDEIGEIVIQGHNVMKGYYNKETATREAIVDGWFHTGDMARMDAEGYFFIVDRKKDLIIRGGLNVYPREIEDVLYGHPAILEASVVGIPKNMGGEEEVWAFVVLKQGMEATSKEIRGYCNERLASFKCPKRVEIVDALPKGPTNKILKRELRNWRASQG